MIDGYSVLVLEYKEMKMENKQTITVDEELLNKLLEVKLDQYFESKKSDIETFITRLVRAKVEETLEESDTIQKTIAKELDLNNSTSILRTTLQVKAETAVNKKVSETSAYTWNEHYNASIRENILKNSSVAGVLHPLLSSLVKDDVNFREVLKGHVELALKAKIDKFLNKTTHTLADEMFNQFVEKYKEKRGEL